MATQLGFNVVLGLCFFLFAVVFCLEYDWESSGGFTG